MLLIFRLNRSIFVSDTIEKDDKEEKKYSAEEKEIDEVEVKKSVSERKKEIERRISEERDKKKDGQAVTMRRSESRERKETKEDSKEIKTDKGLSKSEKESCEEKSISPEPANLTFDEKRLSFELGTLVKEKTDKKPDVTQKFLESEKMVYQMISGPEPEPELSFQEKRLSFEKGLMKTVEEKPEIVDSKTVKKTQMEVNNRSDNCMEMSQTSTIKIQII